MKKIIKRAAAMVLSGMMVTQLFVNDRINVSSENYVVKAAEETNWYSQKGWTYNGNSLSSLCYITSYAMVLKSMGFDVTPLDVYIANGKTAYCYHSTIANYYGVDATSETGSLSSMSIEQKQDFIKKLLEKYPQGVIVGGYYSSGGSHYVVAKKVVDNIIYFDDPAYATEAEGCCIPVSNLYKLTWATITTYRVVKTKDATDVVSPSSVPVAVPDDTAVTGSAITSENLSQGTQKEEPEATVAPTKAPAVTPSPTPSVYNPLGKYKVPEKTIYYKKPVMSGEEVKWIEASLKTLGYKISVNGKFTAADKNIVKKYQAKKKLTADGYVGKKTRSTLLNDVTIAKTKVKKVKGLNVQKDTVSVLSSRTSSSCSATATWTNVSGATGYELIYSKDKKFTKYDKIDKKTNSAEISKLQEGDTYYIKVRAYKKVNGLKVYGEYSARKAITV